jgi:hypothetical protein
VKVELRRPIRRLRRLLGEILVTLHAMAVLAFVELLIRWVRLPRLAHLLGVRLDFGPVPANIERLRVDELSPRVRRQVRCAARATAFWPIGDGPCLRRSLVIGHLLRRHGAAVRLGVAGAGEAILAHAWVEIDGRPIEDVSAFDAFRSTLVEARS